MALRSSRRRLPFGTIRVWSQRTANALGLLSCRQTGNGPQASLTGCVGTHAHVQSPLPVTCQCCPEGRPERVRGRQHTPLWHSAQSTVGSMPMRQACVAASSRQVLACGQSTGAVRFSDRGSYWSGACAAGQLIPLQRCSLSCRRLCIIGIAIWLAMHRPTFQRLDERLLVDAAATVTVT